MREFKFNFKASYLFYTFFSLLISLGSSKVLAQDASIFVSPFDMGKTLSNLYFSIDKNGFTYVNSIRTKATPAVATQFAGKVEIITFDAKDITKIIACEPTAALDFPLKIIVWEEENDIYIAYINPIFYKRRHFIGGCDDVLNEMSKSMIRVVNDAIRSQ